MGRIVNIRDASDEQLRAAYEKTASEQRRGFEKWLHLLQEELDRRRESAMSETKPDWQTIETAPKDGTRILLRLRGRTVCGAWTTEQYAKKPRPYWTNDSEHIFGKSGTRIDQPTHWMPLPDPPKEQS